MNFKTQTGNFTLELLFGMSILAIGLLALIREEGMLLKILGELSSRNTALKAAISQEESLYGGVRGSQERESAVASCQLVSQVHPYQALKCGDDSFQFLLFEEVP